MEQLLSGIPGISVFLDDIKISAEDDETHRQRIEEVLKRLDEHNMRVNLAKSEFMSDRISYCGYVIDKHGIHKMSDKVKAIQNMKTPVNKDEFEFDSSCERAFQEVKAQIQSDVVLTHYDPKRPLLLAVDASPVGVGAVLSHQFEDGTERPIQVTNAVRNENATLCAVFICKKSKDNGKADAMSRLPIRDTYQNIDEVDLVEEEAIANLPVTRVELRQHTEKDKSVNDLVQCLKHGRECEPPHRFGIPQAEFTLHDGCLLRSIRIYIPKPLRKRVLDELHTAHLGMSAMKALGRTYCWWPGMDKDIDQLVSNCTDCQSIRADPAKINPVHVWMRPTKPFERVHVDYAGPFLGKYLFILVDAYTKWPEAHIMPNMTASCTVQKCEEIFATFGIPQILVSDHGTQFNSVEFQTFLRSNGIFHKQGAPYHPSTNGQDERGANMQRELSTILMAYRRAVHPATQQSPAVLMLGRQLQSRLDLLNRKEPRDQNERIRPQKEFLVGERVAIRDYLSANKWRFGRVAQRQGDLHYQVQLDDNRTWKRHADQMRKVGEDLVGVESSNVRSDGAMAARKSIEAHASPPRQCETTQADSDSKQNEITTTAESSNNASKTAVLGEVLLRRSTRATKPPERLQYEHT
ncbi:uncharacterized protein K02A2.6-like [Rhagoletis pomonella]|uniref:uncharacterized protein K02A2.6-like n=1 Tax=Rhagoletis pomonella TaxID=28610 RepID=UPI00177D3D03|nr:uncharacterized protein K02A2.6-like [Rhagoletis pomonella]